jgi:hypothetical protein
MRLTKNAVEQNMAFADVTVSQKSEKPDLNGGDYHWEII